MRPSFSLLVGLAAPLFLLLSSSCGGDTTGGTTGGTPDADDGKFHPPGNGTPMSEADACKALSDAQSKRFVELGQGCPSTSRVCPDFLRVQSGVECLQYDEGAVQGCLQFYSDATTCTAVSDAATFCVVATIAASAPKGCP